MSKSSGQVRPVLAAKQVTKQIFQFSKILDFGIRGKELLTSYAMGFPNALISISTLAPKISCILSAPCSTRHVPDSLLVC